MRLEFDVTRALPPPAGEMADDERAWIVAALNPLRSGDAEPLELALQEVLERRISQAEFSDYLLFAVEESVPFFAVWRSRVRGGGSWIEVSAGYATRAEAREVTPQQQGIPEHGVYKLVVEAPTEDAARRAFEHWESTNRPLSPSD